MHYVQERPREADADEEAHEPASREAQEQVEQHQAHTVHPLDVLVLLGIRVHLGTRLDALHRCYNVLAMMLLALLVCWTRAGLGDMEEYLACVCG